LTFMVNLFFKWCILLFWLVHGFIVSFLGSFASSLHILWDGSCISLIVYAKIAKIFLKLLSHI